eukprot:TRINITY_DN3020_c0_g1_i4.p1 TRINITY_DN3020_c0_g1~~TRINITY_DN3020_c0_g1_i4.p1  ORF type:complete len:129 (-),score=4.98 TRINITY_DN3020_c0_g1_i4:66-452(-)
MYASQYCQGDAAIIVSYVLPGNPYPVIENHAKSGNLVGKPIQSGMFSFDMKMSWLRISSKFHQFFPCNLGPLSFPGYQSHYVLTQRNGSIADPTKDEIFDELVIGQESQAVPVYIVIPKPTINRMMIL